MPDNPLADIIREEMSELSAYVPTRGSFRVRLDANEAPPLLSRSARDRLAQRAAEVRWERYPDATATALRSALAARTGHTPDEVLVGVGSDEVIALLLTVLGRPRGRAPAATIVTTTPTFVMYKMSARARGFKVVEVPLDDSWDIAIESMTRAIEMARPNVVFVASPNNPTGNLASEGRLDALVTSAPDALIVVDEAYVDYADRHQLDLVRRYSNVAVLRTLSKIGLAALRVGWMIGPPSLVAEVDKARQPYNLNAVSQALAEVAVTELSDDLAAVADAVRAERERVSVAIAEMARVEASPSDANFLWLNTGTPAKEVFEALSERGVLVRSFHSRGGRLANRLRVTIGTPDENDAFIAALREVA